MWPKILIIKRVCNYIKFFNRKWDETSRIEEEHMVLFKSKLTVTRVLILETRFLNLKLSRIKSRGLRIDSRVSRIKSQVEKYNELVTWLISQETKSSNRPHSGMEDHKVPAADCDKWLLQAPLSFLMKQNLCFQNISTHLTGEFEQQTKFPAHSVLFF